LRQLSTWQTNLCAQVQEAWGTLLARPVALQPGKVEPVQLQAALNRLPDDGLGIYFSIGESLLPSMLIFSARQIQGLIADLLDLPGDHWPQPARLSAAEEAMLEVLFQKFGDVMGDAWPANQPLKCRYLENTTKPQRTRLFPAGSALFSVKFKILSRFGEEHFQWLLLKEETERLLQELIGDVEPEERQTHPDLVALTEKVPLQIVVELGRTELSMSQAAHLSVGDVLVLDQFVSRPLIAKVEGEPKWAGVPMRIGSRQAFSVTQMVDAETASSVTNYTVAAR
jgi:flagellar motor switch protein FliM